MIWPAFSESVRRALVPAHAPTAAPVRRPAATSRRSICRIDCWSGVVPIRRTAIQMVPFPIEVLKADGCSTSSAHPNRIGALYVAIQPVVKPKQRGIPFSEAPNRAVMIVEKQKSPGRAALPGREILIASPPLGAGEEVAGGGFEPPTFGL